MPSSPSSAEAPGRVVSGHGRRLVVEADDGSRVLCHTRGKRSDAVVGDRVRWQASGDEGVIDEILPRTNLLYRQDDWKTKAFAANIDQLLVVVAAEPVFSESQLARALIAAAEAGIAARIVLNKRDLPAFAAARGAARALPRDRRRGARDGPEEGARRRPRAARAAARRSRDAGARPERRRQEHARQPDGRRREGADRRDLASAQHRPPHDDGDAVVLARRRAQRAR